MRLFWMFSTEDQVSLAIPLAWEQRNQRIPKRSFLIRALSSSLVATSKSKFSFPMQLFCDRSVELVDRELHQHPRIPRSPTPFS